MIIPLTEILSIFHKIVKKQTSNQYNTAIIVSYNTDALCAFQILTDMLKSEGVLYNVFPCQGFIQMDEIVEDLKHNESLRNIIFINCGAVVDLTQKWFAEEQCKIKVYVFDNHRPIQHNNVHSQKKIIVVNDDISNLHNCPTNEDFEMFENDNNIDQQEEEEEEFSEEEEEMFGEEQGENSGEEEIPGQKRRNKPQMHKKQQKKQKLQDIEERINEYYEGYFYGLSTAYIMFKMAKQCSKDSNDSLWLAILGVTDLYIHSKFSQGHYIAAFQELNKDVQRINGAAFQNEVDDQQQNKPIGYISSEKDYRFMLLKHWNLYESIKYSNIIAPKLGIWHDKNKKGELESLIAKLGIPLVEAKQKYKFMDFSYKKQLKQKLIDVGEQFKLEQVLLYESFVRQIDVKVQLTATDMVHCISTILECPKVVLHSIFQDYQLQNKIQQEESQDNPEETKTDNEQQQEIEDESRVKNFYWALDVIKDHLNGKTQLLQQGVEIAIEFQKALVNEAMFLFERRGVEMSQNFRIAFMKKEGVQNKKYFQHPYSLQKLAMYMMEVYKQNRKQSQRDEKPIVLACQNHVTNSYQVVGVVPFSFHSTQTKKNDFGNRFLRVVTENNFGFKQNDFETSVIEIAQEDIEQFIEELTIN